MEEAGENVCLWVFTMGFLIFLLEEPEKTLLFESDTGSHFNFLEQK